MECRVRPPSWELGECPIPSGCRFDVDLANRAVCFFQRELSHTTGRWAGQPFQLRTWQMRDIREIYGRVRDDGTRVIRTVYKEIPKKNGKSEECAGHALKLLFADSEYGAQVYGAAADRDQASIIFDVAASMVRHNPRLKSRSKVLDTTKRILFPAWEGRYRVLSAQVAGKHGFNSSGVVFDEAHTQRDMRLWEVLTFGAGASRTQPLVIAVTTAGVTGESPVAEMLHEEAYQISTGVLPCPESLYPVLYAAPTDAKWDDEEVWHACNPALGDFLSLDSVREEFQRARSHPSEQNSFRRLRLNQWVNQVVRWIDIDEWDKGGKFTTAREYHAWFEREIRELREFAWFGGLDLSTKRDVTAFALICLDGNDNIHILPHFWIPRDNLQDRPNMEAARYRIWMRDGLLTATAGNEVDFDTVRSYIKEAGSRVKISEIGYDPAFAPQLAQQLTGDGFTMVNISQNFPSFTGPCMEFESAVATERILHGGNPVLRWMVDCTSLLIRSDGKMRPVKPNRLKSSKRIDGVVAALMGINRAVVNRTPRKSAGFAFISA